MFKNDKSIEIEQLKNRITELEQQLNEVANDNGSVIIKQLPNGKVELNGIEIDNNSEVEYYNSSKATYGELTMFRIGKETKQREMNKLIESHIEECDDYKFKINYLQDKINSLQEKIEEYENILEKNKENEFELNEQIKNLNNQLYDTIMNDEDEKNAIISRYESMIANLKEDIVNWQNRYLKLNNVAMDGTIITKYGEIVQQ